MEHCLLVSMGHKWVDVMQLATLLQHVYCCHLLMLPIMHVSARPGCKLNLGVNAVQHLQRACMLPSSGRSCVRRLPRSKCALLLLACVFLSCMCEHKQVYMAAHSSPGGGLEVLEELLAGRRELAGLLGSPSWAHYQVVYWLMVVFQGLAQLNRHLLLRRSQASRVRESVYAAEKPEALDRPSVRKMDLALRAVLACN